MRRTPVTNGPPALFVLVACALAAGACDRPDPVSARSPAPTSAAEFAAAPVAIRAVLDTQVAAWNRGDLDAFMDGYLRSDSLRFASGGQVRYGWDATLEGYRRGYPDRAAMGTLAFDSLDVTLLADSAALVFGRWALAREASLPPASGLFTLLFRRAPEGWRIAADHTSSASE